MATEKLGRYEILSELGQGAMGVVYKAIDPLIERTVAIKTIKLDLSKEELANFEERFYREAKSAGRLNHPNIVTIYDVGKSDNSAYMAMEFLEGQLLREVLDAHTALSIDKIVDIAAQVADGLAYAHENGIVHRDIKPANIMLVRDDMAKIMDFGIAQMPTGSRTLAGTVMGSPKYMAPEQVIGKPVDGRSDIFALGVMLYEMLTGESPFDGDNINTIMYRILNETPVPPKSLAPRIPGTFNYIIAKALAKEPGERYQSAKDMASDLRNYNNLTIPEAEVAALNRPRTLDRRSKPRSNMGEETLFLNDISGGLIGSKTTTGHSDTTQINAADTSVSSFWHSKKILIIAIAVLLLAFIMTVMLGKTSHQKDTAPAQLAATIPAPVITESPAKSIAAPDNRTTKATEPSTPAPQISANTTEPTEKSQTSVPPSNTGSVKQSAHKTDKSKTSLPATSQGSHDITTEKGEALISFAVSPWGEIYVDGKKAGVSPPLKELTVSAGKHRIEIRNLNFTPYSETIDLKAESTKNIKYIFN